MKVLFVGAHYYGGPVHHLYRIFEIYKAIGDVFNNSGVNTKYFVKDNDIIPAHDIVKECDLMAEIESSNLVLIWNGQQSGHIVEKCRQHNIPIYFSELGWLPQNGTFYFDKKGVNYESTLTEWQYASIKINQWEDLEGKLAYYHNVLAKKTGTGAGEEPGYVFVPLQVENDSQILRHSHRIKKMQQLIYYVAAFIPGKIIFKTHPKDNIEGLTVPDHCRLYTNGTTHDFLPNCKYVITINSTVGVEALTYYKPVITLGDAFYEGRMMTYKVSNDAEFKNAIKWASEGRAALGVIEAFLYYLFNQQWYSSHLKDSKRILRLLKGVL